MTFRYLTVHTLLCSRTHSVMMFSWFVCTDPLRFRITHQTSFIKAHNNFLTRSSFFFYMGCFFRQFFRSVTKADYITLRNGFIMAHNFLGCKFDFRKYIKRSLVDDFQPCLVGVICDLLGSEC